MQRLRPASLTLVRVYLPPACTTAAGGEIELSPAALAAATAALATKLLSNDILPEYCPLGGAAAAVCCTVVRAHRRHPTATMHVDAFLALIPRETSRDGFFGSIVD